MDSYAYLRGNPFVLPAPRSSSRGGGASAQYLPPEEVESNLAYLGRQTLNTVDTLGRAIDTPAAIFRGMLAGKPLSGFTWNDRVSGEDLLKSYGLLSENNDPWVRWGAGLAAEIALDPLLPLSGALKALSPAGKAAKAAGILADAPYAALLKMGKGNLASGVEAARKTWTGRNAYQFLGDLIPSHERASAVGKLPGTLSPENLRLRPMVGPRVTNATTTLDETVRASSSPTAMKDVLDYLKSQNIPYDSVKNQKLGGAFSFKYPGMKTPVVFNPDAALPLLGAMDALTQAGRWSLPARLGSRITDSRVGGELPAAEQFFQMRGFDRAQNYRAIEREAAARHHDLVSRVAVSPQAKAILGAETLQSPAGGDFLTRMFEGAQTKSDMQLRSLLGPQKVDDIVNSWRAAEEAMFQASKGRGLKSIKRVDKYGLRWTPRVAREADFGEYGTGLSRAMYTAARFENEIRRPWLITPGGTSDLRRMSVEIPSIQDLVQNGEASKVSIEQAGRDIKAWLDRTHGPNAANPRVVPFKTFVPLRDSAGEIVRQPMLDDAGNMLLKTDGTPRTKVVIDPTQVITQQQGEKIARFLQRKNKALGIDEPMFGEFASVTQTRARDRFANAVSNADEIAFSLAEAAVHAGPGRSANSLPGGGIKGLDAALGDIATKTDIPTVRKKNGATVANATFTNTIKRAIAKRDNIADWTSVNLAEYGVSETVVNRLRRTADFYNSPRAQQDVVSLFDQYTGLFKSFALAFPATKVRDFYSNAFLVWAETGASPREILRGYRASAAILNNDYATAQKLLSESSNAAWNIYKGMSPEQFRASVIGDVSNTGLLQSLATNDLLLTNRSGALNQLIPGSTPTSLTSIAKSAIPDGSRSLGQMAKDQFTFRNVLGSRDTKNTLLNTFESLSDYIDSTARLAGFFAMRRQGVNAATAAKRITSALVDYSSLTAIERNVLRRLLPWYSYVSRSGKYIVNNLIQNPGGRYAQTLRAQRLAGQSNDDVYVPEALRQDLAIPVPAMLKSALGIPEKAGTTTFFSNFDIPGVDVLNTIGLGNTTYGTVNSTLYNLQKQVHPLAKSLFELSSGMDSFSRRPLQQSVQPVDRLWNAYSGSKTGLNPLVRQLINLTPGPQQRLLPIFGGLRDDRLTTRQALTKQAFNTLAGVKLIDVDPEWQLQDARRQYAERLGDFTQDYTESFIPKDVLPQVPAELMPDYYMFQTLGKQLRDARKARRQQ